MKTVLVLSVLFCAAFAAPAEDKKQAPEAPAEALKEEKAAAPEPVLKKAAAPESRFNFCPDGWFSHNFRCYMFVNTPMSWQNAENHCRSLGANLASVTDPSAYSFLQQITQTASQSVAWIGGFNLQGQWMWTGSDMFFYTNWYSQNSYSSYPCIYLRTAGGWSNTACSTSYRFICSINPFKC